MACRSSTMPPMGGYLPNSAERSRDDIRGEGRKAVPRLADGHVDGRSAGRVAAQKIAQPLKGRLDRGEVEV